MGTLKLIWDVHQARKFGQAEIEKRQKERFNEIVTFARKNSLFYQKLYKDLPNPLTDIRILPVASKKALMANFNDWTTDREVTIEKARDFVNDPSLIGAWFLGRYTIATTSGTTGTPGIFLIDDFSFSVTKAISTRMLSTWLKPLDLLKIASKRARMAMLMATEGHYASSVAAARMVKKQGKKLKLVEALSVHMPMNEIVNRLNKFQPAILAPYASMASLLANEQEAGRLKISPALIALSAEGLPLDEYARIAKIFGSKVGNSYASTECPFLSHSCNYDWLHVNSDWVILEVVNAKYEPVPPGEQSHTVLITNLANRIQPILRYDLGDSVIQRPDPCPCGSPFPAIRVQGRSADVLVFKDRENRDVSIPPLALDLDDIPGVELFQIVQVDPEKLCLHLQLKNGANLKTARDAAERAIKNILNRQGLDHVIVEHSKELPKQSSGGKFRKIVPLQKLAQGSKEVTSSKGHDIEIGSK